MTARAHLHLVDTSTGEAEEVCAGCIRKDRELTAKDKKILELRRGLDEAEGKLPDSKTVLEVLRYHHKLFPRSRIAKGKSPAKTAVRAMLAKDDELTGRPMFTPHHLKGAAMGLKLNRMGDKAGRPSGAAWLYADEDRVQYWIDQATEFRLVTGTSALTIVDQLGRPGLERLAAVCSHCGRTRLEHEFEPDGQGLFDPLCPGFDSFDWEIDVWKRQRDRLVAEREDVA